MKNNILAVLIALLSVVPAYAAEKIQIGDLYYYLDSTSNTATVTSPSSGKYSGNITIPSTVTYENNTYSVTTINDLVFYLCKDLISITIPNSVTSIGGYAFRDCTGLKKVNYTGDVRGWLSINMKKEYSNPVYYSKNLYINGVLLTDLVIPDGVTEISAAFAYDRGITSITIPNSVTSIGENAFYECTGLTSVTIGNGVTSIGGSAFYGCTGLTSVTIPNSVTNIGGNAFYECTGLTSIIIPNSVTSIGNSAFFECIGLTSVIIDNSVTSIGANAFYGCTGLTSVTIGNGVTSIGAYAFCGCTGLTSITIPNSVTSIGYYAFNRCAGLTSVTIGNGVTNIEVHAFLYCKGLRKVNYTGDVRGWLSIYMENEYSNPIYYSRNLYINDVLLTDLVIPDGVTKISDVLARDTCITSITIPNSVTSIGDYAFSYWNLTSITIPNSVEIIGNGAFYCCTGLTAITIPNSVEIIGEDAFYNCTGLTSITIPNSVTSIGSSAFSGCTGLTSVAIPYGITSIEYGTFSGCTGLTSITIPNSVTSIGWYAFRDCTGLTSVTIPNSVTSIGKSAFSGCYRLTSVTIGASVTSIGDYAFNNFYVKNVVMLGTIPPTVVADNTFSPNATICVPCEAMDAYLSSSAWASYKKQINGLSFNVDGLSSYVSLSATKGGSARIVSSDCSNNMITIEAIPDSVTDFQGFVKSNYKFVRWSDGNTDNPRTMIITSDINLVAEFVPNQYTISASAENGQVEGAGIYDYGTTATLTAVANEHYHFTQWSDGNTDNPRTVVVEGDATYTAEFAENQYTIMVTCDAQQGSVFGGGTYGYGSQVTLGAIANKGYEFTKWSNGVTNNPYQFTAAEDLTLEAEFIPATAIDNISADTDTTTPQKVLIDGQVYILRNNKTYTLTGVEVK